MSIEKGCMHCETQKSTYKLQPVFFIRPRAEYVHDYITQCDEVEKLPCCHRGYGRHATNNYSILPVNFIALVLDLMVMVVMLDILDMVDIVDIVVWPQWA